MTGDRTEGQLFPGVYASAQPPGRGLLIRRGEPHRLVQTGLVTPDEPDGAAPGQAPGQTSGRVPGQVPGQGGAYGSGPGAGRQGEGPDGTDPEAAR